MLKISIVINKLFFVVIRVPASLREYESLTLSNRYPPHRGFFLDHWKHSVL